MTACTRWWCAQFERKCKMRACTTWKHVKNEYTCSANMDKTKTCENIYNKITCTKLWLHKMMTITIWWCLQTECMFKMMTVTNCSSDLQLSLQKISSHAARSAKLDACRNWFMINAIIMNTWVFTQKSSTNFLQMVFIMASFW